MGHTSSSQTKTKDIKLIEENIITLSQKRINHDIVSEFNLLYQGVNPKYISYIGLGKYVLQYFIQSSADKQSALSTRVCVVFDPQKKTQQINTITNDSYIYNEITPLKKNKYIIETSNQYLQIDQNRIVKSFARCQSFDNQTIMQFTNLMFLHQSRRVLKINNKQIVDFEDGSLLYKFGIDQRCYGTTDQIQQIIIQRQNNELTVCNINNKTKRKVTLPKNIFNNNFSLSINFYQIDQNRVIFTQDRYEKTIVYQLNVLQHTYDQLLTQNRKCNFVTLNRQQQILVYECFQSFMKINTVYFYHYGLRKIIKMFENNLANDFFIHLGSIKISKTAHQISSDLKTFAYIENQNEQKRIKVIQQFNDKKMYFNLIKKSPIWINFGERIARQLFKVLVMQQDNNKLMTL